MKYVGIDPVSYTHLDVYKRQRLRRRTIYKPAGREICLSPGLSVSKKSACGVLFRVKSAVSLSPLRGSRAGNSVRKPCCARRTNPPRMSPDSI